MEEIITAGIIERFFAKLKAHLVVDCAIVGGGPSGLVCAAMLAQAGRKVAVFESKLAPGGGVWGGGMLMNEIIVSENARHVLDRYCICAAPYKDGFYSVDSVEMSAGLIYAAVHSGAAIFNTVKVEDVVIRGDRVSGVVVNWTPVVRLEMHVDPLVVMAKTVLDATGHPAEIARMASQKAGFKLATATGSIMGERPMWMESGERTTVENTGEICPGLFASGMAANNVHGGFRMGPIFAGMLLSGEKAAKLIIESLDQQAKAKP